MLIIKNGKVIATCDFEPNVEDLASRGEVVSNLDSTIPGISIGDAVLGDTHLPRPSKYHNYADGFFTIDSMKLKFDKEFEIKRNYRELLLESLDDQSKITKIKKARDDMQKKLNKCTDEEMLVLNCTLTII